MANEIREPKQERSIDKKNRIIQAGYELFSEVGYYSTNTADIAKRAGVSTGIVYGYFKDKRDILLDVLELYVSKTFAPVFDMFESVTLPLNFERIISHIVDKTIETHKKNAKLHEVLHSLTASDEAVSLQFLQLEDKITLRLYERMNGLGYGDNRLMEKIHIAMDVVQSYAHEFVYDKHDYLNYDAMRDEVIKMLVALFN